MKPYQTFIFGSHAFDPASGKISLNYSVDNEVTFTETLTLPSPHPQEEITDDALHALHLIGGISYFKTCLPPTIEIRTKPLTPEQADFWNTVYENGLGEFFFRNNLDPNDRIHFPSAAAGQSSTKKTAQTDPQATKRILVPIGGGKDSVVTAELLRKAGHDVTLLRVGSHPLITSLAKEMNLPLLEVSRKLSPNLFKLNEEGALNGHIPITAYLTFLADVMAQLYSFDAVVWSAERSANVGNTLYHGMEINHQWSKSLTFERAHGAYTQGIPPSFSLLRPWSELRIAQEFVNYPQYLPFTTSCNANWKIVQKQSEKLWCGHCPKCAFVYALYAAFLPQQKLNDIFGKDLFADPDLLPLFKQLLGTEGFKPFECVGTPEETKAAFCLAHDRKEWNGTPIMDFFEREVLPTITDCDALLKDALTPSGEHDIPPHYFSILPS